MPCMTADGLSMVIVTLPAFAVSAVLSNLNAPPGSADCLSVAPPPFGAFVGVAFVGVADVDGGAAVDFFLLLPQPVTARPRARVKASGTRAMRFISWNATIRAGARLVVVGSCV